ncbi:hypothetical protein [Specibacter sp. NPDC078709]|uniref:hypothetical protein n=1 Tax=Specibacter sp. NPDC078709 TaxID=3154364 RepID=UPI0034218851
MSSNVTADLIRALIENMDGASDDGESLAIILEIRDGKFSGGCIHGRYYKLREELRPKFA